MMSTDSAQKNAKNNNLLRVDFHSHSNCSDGHLSPQELIDRASNFQIDQFAITDHDSVRAIAIAKQHISDKNLKLRLISGIELSTLWQNFEIHILGLNIDVDNEELLTLIASQQTCREQRAIAMAEKLAKIGFANCYEDAKALASDDCITRAHFARVLHHRGVVSTMQKAFDKYIGKGQRAYVKPTWCDLETAINVIQQSGGVSIIAHPMKYKLSAKWLKRLIVDFKDANGDGMEVVSGQRNDQQRDTLIAMCREYQLQASVGSDFHFPNRWSDVGKHLAVPDNTPVIWQQWN